MVTIWAPTISIRYQGPICTGGSHTVAIMGEFGRLRRAAATAVSIVLLTLGGLLLAEPAQACACRSEEHTSELQSRFDLVCRLLLEKKKKKRSSTACKYI